MGRVCADVGWFNTNRGVIAVRELPSGLQAHLDGGATTLCWCWKLVRSDGATMGFTDHDETVAFGGVDYEAATGFTATEITSSLGLSVDNLDVDGALSSEQIKERDIAAGLYDNAAVEIWRVNWRSTGQRALMRSGNLGEISRGQTFFRAELRGLAHQLQQPNGRIFQSTCDADLGDNRCRINLNSSSYRATGAVNKAPDARTIHVPGMGSYQDGWFTRGEVEFLSGANDGLTFSIRGHAKSGSTAIISLWEPVAFDVDIGGQVRLVAGCDKRVETCRGKFDNVVNFQGFPHMPGSDFIFQYPNRDDKNLDGSTRYDSY